MPRHLLRIADLSREDAWKILHRAKELKDGGIRTKTMDGRTAILIFEKSSTRTRVSFEVAVRHLGGQTIFMTPVESQLGRSEPLKDTARCLSRYADCLVVRTYGQEKLETLVRFSSIPVVNALSDEHHPCQVLSDMLSMYERTSDLGSLRVAWIGDGNNMAHSFIDAAALFGFDLVLACPAGYDPDPAIVAQARERGARVTLTRNPEDAARDADYLNTDVWASMGQEGEQRERERVFAGFQVDDRLLSLAKPACKVMHCLPAHRGEEISEAVLEGPASIVFDQAENRLHMQKAVLEWVFGTI
ncbi:MAG TPA: ornithine carbamoyltransferase [Desulfovibrio sp.]|jgi:ornithine carbamoyltransferase|uniref:ornithine carbamoyltransferase n=1 Tax=Desulfovibrio TaxID=872 RepID=UPI002A3CE930|nr:ornithine carbamoyltransferase [Desulfovibrio sp.]MDY0307296.1 ornithine carbamoyltransferase [Desulfovibrionaceae bacterium]HMM37257.1 ornithine carbamoyltransferase [Desulfovibrio sp.]